ncbi:hypothetical protein CLOM_g12357 [Closterium sp. NIES-68]|nr:hypothetical protein CLOM_g12357 [Closterium sp. NIES-68]
MWKEGSTDTSAWQGLEIDDNGNVVSMVLISGGVEGPLPTALAALTALTSIDLRQNKLTGEIPRGVFSQDAYLKEFYLAITSSLDSFRGEIFSGGRIPAADVRNRREFLHRCLSQPLFQNAPNLQTFTASGNKFAGHMRLAWRVGPLVSVIDLSNNQLTGEFRTRLAEWTDWKCLTSATTCCRIPASVFRTLSALVNLDVSNNKLSGYLPLR